MAVITTGSHPKALWPGVNAWWGVSYNQHEKEWTHLFTETKSTQSYEEDVQTTGFGLVPQKPQGSGVSYDSHQQGFTSRYTNVSYGMGYIVTSEELEDNLYSTVSMSRARSLAFSTNQTIETVAANVYNRAFNSAYLGGDGVSLIHEEHPNSTGGTWSNQLTTAADLSEASLEDMLIQVSLATNDRGLKIALRPDCLIVHPNDWFEANRILKSSLQNDTANNAINVLHATNALPGGIKLNHYLSDTDAWFVRTKCPEGLKFQWRKKPTFDQDNEFDTGNAKAKVVFRCVPYWTDPRDLFASPGV
jgi:hypothetical protein